MRKRNTLALHCGSQIRVAKIIKRSFSTLLHVCPYRVETKSSRLFNGVNGNTKPVNSSMGKLTLPSAADFSCIFSLSLFLYLLIIFLISLSLIAIILFAYPDMADFI